MQLTGHWISRPSESRPRGSRGSPTDCPASTASIGLFGRSSPTWGWYVVLRTIRAAAAVPKRPEHETHQTSAASVRSTLEGSPSPSVRPSAPLHRPPRPSGWLPGVRVSTGSRTRRSGRRPLDTSICVLTIPEEFRVPRLVPQVGGGCLPSQSGRRSRELGAPQSAAERGSSFPHTGRTALFGSANSVPRRWPGGNT